MNIKITSNQFKILFWLVILVGISLRIFYMVAPVTKLSADESVYGVQALNILNGERSVFYYNQNYTGTLSAFITAFLFAFFGINSLLVKLPILIFAIGFLFSAYFLAKLVFNSKGAALAVLTLTALTGPFWMNWTTRAGTGYPETMLLGNLILILVIKIVFGKQTQRFITFSFFGMGLLAGLGYWIQPTIIYYLLPASLVIFFWKPKIIFSRFFLLGFLGFVIGSLPVIIFNLNHQNLNTQSLFHKPFGVKKAMIEFFTVGLPVIFGLRKPFSTVDFYIPLTLVICGIYLVAWLLLLRNRFGNLLTTFSLGLLRSKRKLEISTNQLLPIDLILIFLVSVFLVFSLSSPFNQFVSEPRYISPLYSGLPILIVYLALEIKKRSSLWAMLVGTVVLLSQGWGLVQLPPNSFQGPVDLTQTIVRLQAKGIKYVDTHAYLSYRLILESKGSIIAATQDNPPIEARYPEYRRLVNAAPLEEKAFLLDHTQPLAKCNSNLEIQMGPCHEEKLVNGLYLYTWR